MIVFSWRAFIIILTIFFFLNKCFNFHCSDNSERISNNRLMWFYIFTYSEHKINFFKIVSGKYDGLHVRNYSGIRHFVF